MKSANKSAKDMTASGDSVRVKSVGGASLGVSPTVFAAGIVVCALFLRLGLLLHFGGQGVEVFEYEVIAENLLAGRGFGIEYLGTWYRTFGSPPFSYLCAAIYWLFGKSHYAMLGIQAVFSSIAALGCYGIGCRLFSPRIGLAAAALVAFHPGLIYVDTHKIHPLSFDAALAVLGVELVLALKTTRSWKVLVLSGLLHGLALFERSTFAGLILLAVFSLWLSNRGNTFARLATIYLLAVVTITVPWVLRNFHLYQEPILISTTGGEVFWRGNNVLASGGGYAEGRPGIAVFEASPEGFQNQILGKDELTQNRIFTREALSFILSQPMMALQLYGRKLFAFWWFSKTLWLSLSYVLSADL